MSYGGSSVLSTLIMFAIIQGLYIIKEDEEEDIEKKKEQQKNVKRTRPSAQRPERSTLSGRGDARASQTRQKTRKEKEIEQQRIR